MASPSTQLDYAHPTLRREIGLFGAVMLGLGSILGTGVFVSLAHATELAGPWVLLAIVLAGLLAYCNAMSSAQLAAAYPVSGGTYEYGYRVLNPALGFTAGWMFLLAKSASAATVALALGLLCGEWLLEAAWKFAPIYLFDPIKAVIESPATSLTILLIVVLLGAFGLRRSNAVVVVTVFVTLLGLVAVWLCAMFPPDPWLVAFQMGATAPLAGQPHHRDLSAMLGAAAITFVAFTGYGRLATLGEEVQDPARSIPRAILIALFITILVYLLTALAYVRVFESADPAYRSVPELVAFSELIDDHFPLASKVTTFAAVTAMLGVLLNLILGLSRVWLAMGRRGDMPRILARVNEKTSTPVPATILTGVLIALLVLEGDVRTTWSFSAFTVLIYYAITNLACLRLAPEHRRYPRFLAWVGLFACLSLAWFVEMKVWIAGTILIAVGLIWHRIRRPARTEIA